MIHTGKVTNRSRDRGKHRVQTAAFQVRDAMMVNAQRARRGTDWGQPDREVRVRQDLVR